MLMREETIADICKHYWQGHGKQTRNVSRRIGRLIEGVASLPPSLTPILSLTEA